MYYSTGKAHQNEENEKFPVGSSVKFSEVIHTNLHFLPTKMLSLLTYKIHVLPVWKEFHFPVEVLQTCLVVFQSMLQTKIVFGDFNEECSQYKKLLYSERWMVSFSQVM